MRWTLTVLILLAAAAAPCCTEHAQEEELCIYSARCLTNSPRLIKVHHSPQSMSYSYFYQVPRRIRKVVRRKIVKNAATVPPVTSPPPTIASEEDVPEERHEELADEASLFDHIQLTPVFGRRIRAQNVTTAAPSSAATDPAGAEPSRRHTRPTETVPSRNRLEEEGVRPRRPLTHRQRVMQQRRRSRLLTPPEPSDADLSEHANVLEEASAHGTPSSAARAFRVDRLKRRRRIMAKKLVRTQVLAGQGPDRPKKVLKVVAVKKTPPGIPGLSEVYHDNLINSLISEEYPTLQPSPGIKGFPGVDYPIHRGIPETSFSCSQQRYWGMYADTETQCQVWHYCDQDGHKHSFLCPNGTVFSQVTFICDWWFNVDCNNAVQLYVTNEALSLLPAPPEKTFPEDFKGPIVDWYIYQRHQERAYRKEKFLRQLEEGKQLAAIRFLETHDFPPWFTPRDQALYLKLKALERKSKHHIQTRRRPVKKELSQYTARW